MSNLPKCLLLGCALLCCLSPAAYGQGSIVYHPPVNEPVLGHGLYPAVYGIDLNNDSVDDFVLEAYTSFRLYSTTGGRSIAIPSGGTDVGSRSVPLLEGFEVGPALEQPLQWVGSFQPVFPPDYWVGQNLHTRSTSGSSGYWNPPPGSVLKAYIGVEFQIGQNTHYGWIQVTAGGVGNGGILHDWAYNAVPGQPILAGQVSEPSTWALLLGGGSAFLLLRRRSGSRSV